MNLGLRVVLAPLKYLLPSRIPSLTLTALTLASYSLLFLVLVAPPLVVKAVSTLLKTNLCVEEYNWIAVKHVSTLAATPSSPHLESGMIFIASTVSLIVLFLAARARAFLLAATFAASLAALANSAATLSFEPPSEHEEKIALVSASYPMYSERPLASTRQVQTYS